MISICGRSRGRYGSPVRLSDTTLRFVDDEGVTVSPPSKAACGHPKHWQWGPGTRNGQRLYYPLNSLRVQKWEMTERELSEAVDEFDMFSLEMPTRLICLNCAAKEKEAMSDD